MLGASYWAYVTNDVLRVHGMCSYGDWFKYQQTLQSCAPVDAGDHWEVDPTRCFYVDLEAQSTNASRWWDPTGSRPLLMYMRPSNCDRDYERLDGFAACAPPADARVHLGGRDVPGGVQFDQYAKMHIGGNPSSPGGVKIPLAKMPYSSDPRYGFLGVGGIKSDSDMSGLFQACSTIDQCTAPPFTVRGVPAKRKRLVWGSWTPVNYTDDDVFRCGVAGYTEGDHCRLDVSVLQIFRFLCVEPASVNGRCAPITPGLTDLCNAVQTEYQAGYAAVSSNVKALYNLMYAFSPPTDLEEYLQTTDCMADLYGYMGRQVYTQPYLVMDFVLFEISFDWFYQCVVMSPTQIDTSSTARSVQDCPAYTNRASYTIEGYTPRSSTGDDAMTMLKFVRGGYTRADVLAYDSLHRGYARGNLSRVKADMVASIYGLNDTSYPRCSLNRRWRMGETYGQPYLRQFRALIDTWYVQGSCSGSWLEDQVDLLARGGWPVTQQNWADYMTTPDLDALVDHPDWVGSPTLLDMIEAFIAGSIRTQLATRVMANYPPPTGVPFVTKRAAIVLNDLKPAAYAGPVPGSLDPTEILADTGELVMVDNPHVPHICVYDLYTDDPAIRDVYSSDCYTITVNRGYVQDRLLQCPGKINCTSAPINYMINGMYDCQYYPSMPGYACDARKPGCGLELLDALYSDMSRRYNQESPPDLPPTLLPWFYANATWGFTFDLKTALDYLGNIMPNKEQTVMCTIRSETPVDLMNCTNPHYAALKSHAKRYFMHNGSAIVPRDAQLEWQVDRAFLAAGGVYSFASTARNISRTFLKSLFDDQTVCKGDTTANNRICWKASNSSTWNSVNPWMLG